jgi:hypothetical protein
MTGLEVRPPMRAPQFSSDKCPLPNFRDARLTLLVEKCGAEPNSCPVDVVPHV